jgi:acetate kinase
LTACPRFAPLHIRAELEGMKLVEKLRGDVPQMAVFDTGFHRQMPLSAAIYPGPYEWFVNGIRRYGFHGINHQYCSERDRAIARERPKVAQTGDLPSGQWLFGGGNSRRPQC